jgi:hypothetical protein
LVDSRKWQGFTFTFQLVLDFLVKDGPVLNNLLSLHCFVKLILKTLTVLFTSQSLILPISPSSPWLESSLLETSASSCWLAGGVVISGCSSLDDSDKTDTAHFWHCGIVSSADPGSGEEFATSVIVDDVGDSKCSWDADWNPNESNAV